MKQRDNKPLFGIWISTSIDGTYHVPRFIVNNHIPLTILEDTNFRSLLITLNPSIEAHLLKADAFKDSIEKEWICSSAIVKQLLATALPRIHISFDLWTSPNGMAILGIATPFVNAHCQNQSVLNRNEAHGVLSYRGRYCRTACFSPSRVRRCINTESSSLTTLM